MPRCTAPWRVCVPAGGGALDTVAALGRSGRTGSRWRAEFVLTYVCAQFCVPCIGLHCWQRCIVRFPFPNPPALPCSRPLAEPHDAIESEPNQSNVSAGGSGRIAQHRLRRDEGRSDLLDELSLLQPVDCGASLLRGETGVARAVDVEQAGVHRRNLPVVRAVAAARPVKRCDRAQRPG